ncbi:hypothetical protein HDV01_001822 [Terramyces sp. JEL0728]|nr:hypothetical protein HDV01_001822 [Terramyces sp. JEL0728]
MVERLSQTLLEFSIYEQRGSNGDPSKNELSEGSILGLHILTIGNNSLTVEERISALLQLYQSRPNVPSNSEYIVFKVIGLSLETDNWDLISYFYPIKIPSAHRAPYFTESIHLVMNNSTGKYDCYIEFPTKDMAKEFCNIVGNKRYMHGELLKIQPSTQEELMKALFPRYKIKNGDASSTAEFISRFEINSLLNRCREIRSRGYKKLKLLARPYQTIISILTKIPWHTPDLLSTIQRDHIFELSKLAIEAIRSTYKSKDYNDLVERLARATLAVPLFTEKQKTMILSTAQMKCPKELAQFVYVPDENQTGQVTPAGEFPVQFKGPPSPEYVRSRQSSMATLNQVDSNGEIAKLEQKAFIATKAYQELYLEHQKTLQELEALDDIYKRLARSYDILEKYCNQLQAENIVKVYDDRYNADASHRPKSKRTFVDPEPEQSEQTLQWLKSQAYN